MENRKTEVSLELVELYAERRLTYYLGPLINKLGGSLKLLVVIVAAQWLIMQILMHYFEPDPELVVFSIFFLILPPWFKPFETAPHYFTGSFVGFTVLAFVGFFVIIAVIDELSPIFQIGISAWINILLFSEMVGVARLIQLVRRTKKHKKNIAHLIAVRIVSPISGELFRADIEASMKKIFGDEHYLAKSREEYCDPYKIERELKEELEYCEGEYESEDYEEENEDE